MKPEEIIEVETASVACDGGGGALGHPRVFLSLKQENAYEVVLTITVTVKNDDKTAFLVEMHQAGIFAIAGIEGPELNHTLGAFCPSILFPYAREAIDSMVTKASFPALMLAPVNFDALYAQQMAQQQAGEEAQH